MECLAVVGVGNLECSPIAIGSLANYFGERPLEVRFWDSSNEALDLMDRYARECFRWNSAEHLVKSFDDLEECLEGVDSIIVCGHLSDQESLSLADFPSDRQLYLDSPSKAAPQREAISEAARETETHPQAGVSSEPMFTPEEWAAREREKAHLKRAFEILRMVNQEEYPFELVNDFKSGPTVDWLNQFA